MKLPTQLWRRFNLHLPGFLLFCLALTIIWAAWQSHRYWDLSSWKHGTLSEASQKLLQQIEAPLQITVFIHNHPELRAHIEQLINRYRAFKPDISTTWINPETHPDIAREMGIGKSGELVIKLNDIKVHIPHPSEEQITQALYRITTSTAIHILAIDDLGGRDLSGGGHPDWGYFSQKLSEFGIVLHPFTSHKALSIPANATSLLLAGSALPLAEKQVDAILEYHRQGGNLLIAFDPSEAHFMQPLLEALGLTAQKAIVTDPDGATQRNIANPALLVVSQFNEHPTTNSLKKSLLLPIACPLRINDLLNSPWLPLIQTERSSLVSSGADADKLNATQESHLLAVVRAEDASGGRAVVLCESDFLANGYIANGDNLQFGLNLLRWVNNHDADVLIVANERSDKYLDLTPLQAASMELVYKIILPIAVIIIGLLYWYRRKKGV